MALSNIECRNAKAAAKPYKLSDEKGLFLFVTVSGSKLWRFKYRFDSKEKLLALGSYPDTSLSKAREKRDEARRLMADGIDPGEYKKATKAIRADLAANSFEIIAREWLAKMTPIWAPTHLSKIVLRLENDVFPWIGSKPISDIPAVAVLAVARRVEGRGAIDTAHRVLQNCGQVFRYAVATGRIERNPIPDLRGALASVEGKHFPSITDPVKVGELLRTIDGFRGGLAVQCALKLAPLVFVRPGELRQAKWKDIDLDNALWTYRVTKTKSDHAVPLSRQAIAIFREIQPLTGHREYVFPGGHDHSKPMSPAAVGAALKRLGFDTKTEITGHGFRAMARTILHERLKFDPAVIEHQLAHRVPDSLGSAYNRTKFLDDRISMMQTWADYLDKLKVGAQVIPLHSNAV